MLPRFRRLTSKRDFDRVYRKGKRFASTNLHLFSFRAANLVNQNISRFGFVVSKKHVSQIVKRNRVKRVLRSLVSSLISTIPKGYEFVITGKPGIDKTSRAQLAFELEDLIGKLAKR